MQSQGNPAAVPLVLKPEVGSCYGHGWRHLWQHFLELFSVFIIYIVISVAGGAITKVFLILSTFFNILISNPLGYGVSWAYLKVARDEKMEVQDMFAGFKDYWNVVLTSLLVTVIVVIGFIVLIVPGIYLACKLAFTPYLVIDKKMKTIDAIKESWRMTGGYGWKVFLIGLLAIPIFIAGLICLVVGVIVSIMWIQMALASLYHAVSMQKTPSAPPSVQTGQPPVITG
jgi:uncharacterized membrane protein